MLCLHRVSETIKMHCSPSLPCITTNWNSCDSCKLTVSIWSVRNWFESKCHRWLEQTNVISPRTMGQIVLPLDTKNSKKGTDPCRQFNFSSRWIRNWYGLGDRCLPICLNFNYLCGLQGKFYFYLWVVSWMVSEAGELRNEWCVIKKNKHLASSIEAIT